jgi:hypothetical protein
MATEDGRHTGTDRGGPSVNARARAMLDRTRSRLSSTDGEDDGLMTK